MILTGVKNEKEVKLTVLETEVHQLRRLIMEGSGSNNNFQLPLITNEERLQGRVNELESQLKESWN